MDIGTGIALLGVWLFPSACSFSTDVHEGGWILSFIVAMATTAFIILV